MCIPTHSTFLSPDDRTAPPAFGCDPVGFAVRPDLGYGATPGIMAGLHAELTARRVEYARPPGSGIRSITTVPCPVSGPAMAEGVLGNG